MPKEGSEIVDIEMQLHHETPKAILCSLGGKRDKGIWLAKSLVEYVTKKQNIIVVTMPQWLAYEKGLI